MITRINKIVKNPLFGGSAVMIIGSNVGNALAYLYHVIIGRMLGPSNYGELSAVLSLLGLLFTSFNFLGLVIVKFISEAKKDEIPSIFAWFKKKTFTAGIIFGVLLMMFSSLIANFLHLNIGVSILISPIVIFGFLAFVYRSFAQGLMKFWSLVISLNLDLVVRLLVGVLLIVSGFSVYGAVWGILISTFSVLLYLQKSTKEYAVGEAKEVKIGSKVISYALPILVATLSTNSMFSTDVILVKHFFDSHDAGIYASLSTLGRIIFYGTGPVAGVMFPMIVKRYSEKTNYNRIFFLSLFLTTLICITILIVYAILPDLSIKILFGDKYLEGSRYLFRFGVFMSLFAISSLIFNFFLSIEKTKVVILSLAAAVFQIFGIVIWHNNFNEVLNVSIYSSLFFLIALIIFYRYHTSNEEQYPSG